MRKYGSDIMHNFPLFMSIAAGGGLGAVLRYSAGLLFVKHVSLDFPLTTVLVNCVGSFFMGLIVIVLMNKAPANLLLHSFLTVGVLGGFTTFSTFSLDVVSLIERGAIAPAGIYVLLSVLLSVGALFLGFVVGRELI